ncbi:MAG: hypothetical protein K6F30_08480 [Lachnospiraceae bacterium]|nr:hypothetical protein [Lachnospiraceae bacterium]
MGEKRLSDELNRYGYVFSVKKTGVLYVIAFALLLIIGRLFSLNLYAQICLSVMGLVFLPLFLRNAYGNQFYQRKFSDLNIYLEQYLYSFQKTGKVLATLEDLSLIFHGEETGKLIDEAKDYVLHTYDESDVEEKGLRIIEKEYDNFMMNLVHRFSLQAEVLGGDYSGSLQILLEARRLWADRIYELQQARNKKRRDILFSIVTSILICLLIYLVSYRLELQMELHPVAQIATVIVLGIDFFIFYKADSQLTVGLVEDEPEELRFVDYYKKIETNPARTPYQKLDHKFLKKAVQKEMEKVFPKWLMTVSLLLQSENVQVAIYRSYDEAPEILKPALKKLMEELKEQPDSMEPYMNFLKDYTLPEVHSAMKMLYSISEGTGGNFEHQITEILERNQRLMDKAEKIKNEDELAGLYGLFLAPQLTAGVKMAVDLMLLVVLYLGQNHLGNM